MSDMPLNNDRLLELLADLAVDSLDRNDQAELDALLGEHPETDAGAMETAATAAMLACVETVDPMPDSVRQATLAAMGGSSAQAPLRFEPRASHAEREPASSSWVAWAGWLAAAACLVVAVFVGTSPSAPALSLADARDDFRLETLDIEVAQWGPWDNPEIEGVTGQVEWSESAQTGFMTFTGLTKNDVTEEQYQLWIIDSRGMDQRISGAIFDSDSSTGEVIVRIEPGIEIKDAAAFAITIEEPEGVWVSDMSRRVVIASLPAG